MRTLGWVDQRIDDFIDEKMDDRTKKKMRSFLRQQFRRELQTPVRIAILGKTGVGKSSTLNALFGTDLPVGHSRPGTQEPIEISVTSTGHLLKDKRGDLLLYDMPGLGEDLQRDLFYKDVYRDILHQCEVAIWIISATEHSTSLDQQLIKEIVDVSNSDLASRLVIGINKADSIYPSNWNKRINLPSREQQRNLQDAKIYFTEKLRKVYPELTSERVVTYSAFKHYNLPELFDAMMDACPPERAWVLRRREKLADPWAFADSNMRQYIQSI